MGDAQTQRGSALREGYGESLEEYGAVVWATGARRIKATYAQQFCAVEVKTEMLVLCPAIEKQYGYSQQQQG